MWDTIAQHWDDYKDQAKRKWEELSALELEAVAGRRDRLIQKLQDAYGMTAGEAEREVEGWVQRLQAESPDLHREQVKKSREVLEAKERLAAEHTSGDTLGQPANAQPGELVSDDDLRLIKEEARQRAATEADADVEG